MGILSFFRRIAVDPTANTIVIAAVSLVPLLGMVGGAVDASRYYMTTTRLQAACDAGALAARKSMDDSGSFGTDDREIGLDFFDQNYDDGLFGLENRQRNYTASNDGVVTGTATGKLPTSLMHIFGYEEFDLSVTCSADINIANTDVMFVLDVTGSMNCPADSTVSCTNGNNNNVEYESGGSNASRIDALRNSVLDFYDVVDTTTSNTAQVRYGIVPYASAVNVGGSLDSAWMATQATYQSRTSQPPTVNWVDNGVQSAVRTSGFWSEVYRGVETITFEASSFQACVNQASTSHWDILIEDEVDLSALTVVSDVTNGSTRTITYSGNVRWEVYYVYNGGGFYYGVDDCQLPFQTWEYTGTGTITVTQTDQGTPWEGWDYQPVTWSLAGLYGQSAGSLPTGVLGQIQLQTGYEGAMVTHNWEGCIEEAATVTGSNFDPIPNNAYDLNIDLVPASDDEKWKPVLPSAIFYRYSDGTPFPYSDKSNWVMGNILDTTDDKITPVTTNVSGYTFNPFDYGWHSCPAAAQKLTEIEATASADPNVMDRTDLSNYLDSLQAKGATFHDFGMIWGARFISPDGIFSSENATAPNGDSIARHIIFMTDGKQATTLESYSMYGIEGWDQRVTGNGDQPTMATNHAARFQAACRAARNKNISVWVIAFGTTLTSNLTSCATSGRAFEADDADELRDTFKDIAKEIAELRLTK